jgi:shikimate 5-dehydrogenase
VAALETELKARTPSDSPLRDRIVMVVGTGGLARGVVRGVQARGANVVLAGRERNRTRLLAEELSCRYVLKEALYSTLHDVLVVCPEEGPSDRSETDRIHSGYLRPGMTVLDLSGVLVSPLLESAEAGGCATVSPRQLFMEGLSKQFHLLTGAEAPQQVLEDALSRCVEDQEPD